MKKKRIALVLAISMIFGVCGCSEKKPSKNPDEKITIKWCGIPYFATAKENSYAEKYLEEKFNVEIEPMFIDQTAYTQKLPIQMSSGDIPDLLYCLDPRDVQNYAGQGFIMELPYETIKQYAPTYFDYINKKIPKLWSYSYTNEANYGIPNINAGGNNHFIALIRKDWLDNVGITKVPETLDELHDAFYKFTYNDPDGNGKNDTYGFSSGASSWYSYFSEIFGAYGAAPFTWQVVNGKVVNSLELPETKEALSTLQEWYKEGIIDPDFITEDNSKITDKLIKGTIGYFNQSGADMNVLDESIPTSRISKLKAVNPKAELARVQPPIGKDKKRGTFVWGEGGHIVTLGRQLKDQPEKVQKILEIIEALQTDEELNTAVRLGEKGQTYQDDADGKSGLKYEFANGVTGFDIGLRLPPLPSFFGIIAMNDDMYQNYLSDYGKEFNNTYFKESYGIPDALMKPDILPSSGEYFSDLVSKELTAFSEIIRGEKPVDYLDEFITIWKNAGGSTLEKEANEMYNKTYDEIDKKVKDVK